jgi:penicillin amidase
MLLQSFDQTKRPFQTQIDQEGWLKSHPVDAAELFKQEGLPWSTTILKEGEFTSAGMSFKTKLKSQANEFDLLSRELDTLYAGALGGIGMGSNNWVVDASRSQTGHAWLANDPHLRLNYPPFWYWVHLSAGKFDTIGASFPGVPFIVSGANQHLSWGLTNAFLPASRVSYVPEQELKDATTTRPLIWVRVWKFKLPFFFKTFRRTPGKLPILPLPSPEGKAMVLRWTGFDLKPEDFMGVLEVMKSQSVKEADQAFSKLRIPSWNFVFADDRGGIGFRAVGRIPRFGQGEIGFGISNQTLSQVETSPAFSNPWKPEEMPHILNPKRGYIVTANNQHWTSTSSLNSGDGQMSAFRAFRIEELLLRTPKHDLRSNQRVQCDVQAVDARFLVPELVKVLEASHLDPHHLNAVQALKSWDFETTPECTACGVFRLMVNRIYDANSLTASSLYRKLNQGADEPLKKSIVTSLDEALKDQQYDPKVGLRPWKALHLNSFEHLAGPSVSPTVPVATPGDDQTVNLGTAEWNMKYLNHVDGPSHRLIVEMSQPPQVYSVLAGDNLDLEHRNLEDPKGAWQKWIQCEQQKKVFPLDWSKVEPQLERVVF